MAKRNEPTKNSGFYSKYGPDGLALLKPASFGNQRRVVSSGLLSVDVITGQMGFPTGRIVTLAGDQNAGKSTTAYRTSANWIAMGGRVFYWDTEGRYDPEVAAANGVPMEDDVPIEDRHFHLVQWDPSKLQEGNATGTFEQVAAAIREFLQDARTIESGGGLVVVDSMNAIKSDKEGDLGEGGGIALVARLMSQWLPQFSNLVREHNGLGIVIKQMRANVSTGPGAGHGPASKVSGGYAMRYYESLVIEYKMIGKVPATPELKAMGFDREGNNIQVTTIKNTAGPFGRVAQFVLSSQYGPDDIKEILTYGQPYGIVTRSASYYTINLPDGQTIKAQGADGIREILYDNLDIMEALKQAIREKAILKPENPATAHMNSVLPIMPTHQSDEVVESDEF